ncbi:Alpha-amylase 2 [Ceratocystis platani]|uniref:Alpha-amylase n=1 Tax=Ceratocystis fimbriata f. sp. platani TaxID=88771 RepID=A0A0F8B355_CERFI|nr:Alpha-amylase 2 [Ceratocystis platani]
MFHLPAILAICTALFPSTLALSSSEWAKQSVYQVLTDRFARTDGSTSACSSLAEYCGGTWQGLINNLDYIQNMGFSAVWISPVVTNIEASGSSDGDSYHGFWAKNFNTVNSHFGSQADLKSLADALHSRGMYLMVDVVANHMAYKGCQTCVDYSTLTPFSQSSYFHSPCNIDYSSQTSIEQCWQGSNTVSLPDLRTEDADVRAFFNTWVSELVTNYSIDGLRIDSAKHQETSFWADFEADADVFLLGEVYSGDPAYVTPYLNYMPGVLNYPMYYWIQRAFQSLGATTSELLSGVNTMKSSTSLTNQLGSFTENHDVDRMASWTSQSSDIGLAKTTIAFTMLMDGIPIIYQGQEQGFTGTGIPANRAPLWTSLNTGNERYTWITTINQIRKALIANDGQYTVFQAVPFQPTSTSIALRKGQGGKQAVSVFTSGGSSSSNSVTLSGSNTGYTANQALVELFSCTELTASSDASITTVLSSGLPKMFYPKTTATSNTCATPTTVAVSFTETVTTVLGDTIKITGDLRCDDSIGIDYMEVIG